MKEGDSNHFLNDLVDSHDDVRQCLEEKQVHDDHRNTCSSPILTPSFRPKHNATAWRKSRTGKINQDVVLEASSSSSSSLALENEKIVPSMSPCKSLLDQQNFHSDFLAPKTPSPRILNHQHYQPSRDIDSDEDIFDAAPHTSHSDQLLPSALGELLGGPEHADLSWTSSMATPLTSNVTASNFNTEERKVLLPSDDCNFPVLPRALFTPDLNDTVDGHLLNTSSDVESFQIQKTPKIIMKGKSLFKNIVESPLASCISSISHDNLDVKETDKFYDVDDMFQSQSSVKPSATALSPNLKFSRHCDKTSRSSPILSGNSDFSISPEENSLVPDGEEDMFANTEESFSEVLSCTQVSSKKSNNVTESTPKTKSHKSPSNVIDQPSTPLIRFCSNGESFLQDISVTALEEVCRAQEHSASLPPVSTPEKATDSKRKRLLFSSGMNSLTGDVSEFFKIPESTEQGKMKNVAEETMPDNCIPDDSFMDHLAALNSTIFSDNLNSVPKVQSMKPAASCSKEFCYSFDKKSVKMSSNLPSPHEPQTLIKEILRNVIAQETAVCTSVKTRSVRPSQDLVVFSKLKEDLSEWNFDEKKTLVNTIAKKKEEEKSMLNNEKITNILPATAEDIIAQPMVSSGEGFQTASGNKIVPSQEAMSKALSLFNESLVNNESLISVSNAANSSSNLNESLVSKTIAGSSGISERNPMAANASDLSDDQMLQAAEEVKQLLQLVNDGEDFHPWHEMEKGCSSKNNVDTLDCGSSGRLSGKSFESDKTVQNSVGEVLVGKNYERKTEDVSEKSVIGFTTGNGKNIPVAEDKLAKAQKLFHDLESVTDKAQVSDHSSLLHAKVPSHKECHFLGPDIPNKKKSGGCNYEDDPSPNASAAKATNGNIITCPVEQMTPALRINNNVLYGLPSESALVKEENFTATEVKQPVRFATANGKAINISKESLSKVHGIFDDILAISADESYEDQISACKKTACLESLSKLTERHEFSSVTKSHKLSHNLKSESHKPKLSVSEAVETAMFSTASGETESLPTYSMKEVESLFDDLISDSEDGFSLTSHAAEVEGSIGDFDVVGFSTGNGRKVKVSNKALEKAKKLLIDVSLDRTDHGGRQISVLKDKSNTCQNIHVETQKPLDLINAFDDKSSDWQFERAAFSTASGKSVQISHQALNKAKNLFENVNGECRDIFSGKEDLTPSVSPKKVQGKNEICIKNLGFSTASGNIVNVSKEALEKTKRLFDDLPMESASPSKAQAKNERPKKNLGFSTASGNIVNVSKEALEKTKRLFDDLPMESASPSKAQAKNEKPKKNLGFSTASGNIVHVSKEALEKTKSLFDNLPMESASPKKVQGKNEKPKKNLGFSTASGNIVHVSKEALEKTKSLFDDLSMDFIQEVNEKSALHHNLALGPDKMHEVCLNENILVNDAKESEPPQNSMSAFSTASGKTVQVSKEAISRVKRIFDVEENLSDDSCDINLKGLSMSPCRGVKRHLDDSAKQIEGFSKSIKMAGFSTAGGKTVSICESALIKAKNLFGDLQLESASDTDKNHVSMTEKQSSAFPLSESTLNDDSGVFMSHDNTQRLTQQNKTPIVIENSFKVPKSMCQPTLSVDFEENFDKSSLTQEVSASTAAFLADDEFFNESESSNSATFETLSTSPSMLTDRNCSLRPMFASASAEKLKPSEPTSPILVKNDNIGLRKRLRRGRLSLSSTNTSKSSSPSLSTPPVTSQSNTQRSSLSLPCKNLSNNILCHVKSITTNLPMSSLHVDQDEANTCVKVTTSRNLFPQETQLSSAAPESPSIKPIDVSPLKTDTSKACNNSLPSREEAHVKQSDQNFLIKKTLTKNQGNQSSAFKTPYKSTARESLKRCPSSPMPNPPQAKQRKISTNLYVSHIHFSNLETNLSDLRNLRPEVAEMRRRAAEEQKHLVENCAEEKDNLLRPCLGSWLSKKSSSRGISIKLSQLTNFELPKKFQAKQLLKLGLKASTVAVTATNSPEFRFSFWDYYSADTCRENVAGIPLGDGAFVILDSKGSAGVEEFERAFLASPGVDPSLIPSHWVKNHYRWLVWKLAAFEWRFPYELGGRCLTPHMLMLQLKYRYDREIDRCERPAIRRILEHDDAPAKRLVLCVAAIKNLKDSSQGGDGVELELTDGWYSVQATIDQEMQHRVAKGVIAIGTKLIMHSAELINCPEGCFPLQAQPDVRLKLFSNSTRRVRWYTKLGFQDNPGPIKIPLDSLLSSGGIISCFSAYVARIYPVVFMEKKGEKTVVRSQRAESKEVAKCERKRQEEAEVVYSQVQAEIQQEQSKQRRSSVKFSKKLLLSLTSGEELVEILESSSDPVSVQNMLTEEQRNSVAEYQRVKQEEVCRDLEARVRLKLSENSGSERQVTAILKVRLLSTREGKDNYSAVLSVWRPSEEITSLFKEGHKITIFGAVANGFRSGELQISANRSTRFHQDCSIGKPDLLRRVTPLSSLMIHNMIPRFGELDIVGLVLRIGPPPQTSGNTTHFQNVYLSDTEQNFVALSFWEGIMEFGVKDLIIPHSYIAVTNLQWRRGGSALRPIPCIYATELSFFTTNPKQSHLQTAFQDLRNSLPADLKTFCRTCEDKLDSILSQNITLQAGLPRTSDEAPRSSDNLTSIEKNLSTAQLLTSNVSSPAIKAHQKVLTDHQLQTPKSVKVLSPKVEGRIAKLERYGEPPSISPIVIPPLQRSIRKNFKAPRRTDSPSMEIKLSKPLGDQR